MASGCARPIQDSERPYLEALGRRVKDLRESVMLTQEQLADGAGISQGFLSQIETGKRRTRRSTLDRIVYAIESGYTELGESFASTAGPALAAESPYGTRLARKQEPVRRVFDPYAELFLPFQRANEEVEGHPMAISSFLL